MINQAQIKTKLEMLNYQIPKPHGPNSSFKRITQFTHLKRSIYLIRTLKTLAEKSSTSIRSDQAKRNKRIA